MSVNDLADLIHEEKYDCPDPKSGRGRDCGSCRDLAEKVVVWINAGVGTTSSTQEVR